MPSTNHDFDDELLSAYVDDELTAAERARVEERLRIDPRAVALVEELRALSSAVKSLPRQTLSRDLRDAVLSSVGRRDAGDEGPSTLSMPTSSERWTARRRGLIWSAIAIAATLLLTVIQPEEEKKEGDVARRSAEKSGEEQKRERFELPADADRPVRFNESPPMLSAPAAPAATAEPASGEADDDVAIDRSRAVGRGGFGGGGGGRLGGEAGEARIDSFSATDGANEELPAAKERELSLASEPAAPGQGAGASSSLSFGDAKKEAGRLNDSTTRAGGPALGGTVEGGETAAARKDVRKADAAPRVVEITMARPDAVARFKQLLVENKIASSRENAPATAAAVTLDVLEKSAAPVEIFVDVAPGQIEQLLARCRADKAFANVSLNSDRQAARLYAGLAPAAASGATSERLLATDDFKTPSSSTLTAETNGTLSSTSAVGKDSADLAKAAESSTYAYGAPAAGASQSPATRAAKDEGRQKIAGDSSGAARVQVLFRFLPIESRPAKSPAK